MHACMAPAIQLVLHNNVIAGIECGILKLILFKYLHQHVLSRIGYDTIALYSNELL